MKNLYKIKDELYIISSSEKIKENTQSFKQGLNGDWFYNTIYNSVARTGDITLYDFKIILTTNKLLIKDGVQEIDKTFLEWFVNNSDCEEVDISKGYITGGRAECGWATGFGTQYKILLPIEDFKHEIKVLTTEEVMKERSSAYEFIDFENKTNLEKLQFPELVKELSEYYKGVPIVEKEERLYTEKDIREAIDYGANLGLADDIGNSFQWRFKQNEFISRKIKGIKPETKTE